VAFAISGGASKGAYEAGLNWAIVQVFSQSHSFGTVLGGQYRTFEGASISGASAGGINTLLGGLTWCMRPEAQGGPANRIDDNIFRDVWLLPDVNSLLPPDPASPRYLPDDALLARRDFLDAAERLRDMWTQPGFTPGCRIPLGVTVTRNEPEIVQIGGVRVQHQRFVVPFELRVQTDARVAFSFDPDDYPNLSDPTMILVPRTADRDPFQIDDDDIIGLALTTSAFPGGFGRRSLQYCRQERFVPAGHLPDEGDHENQPKVCPDDYVLTDGVFSDGGLFDNLPIGLARQLAEEHVDARPNPLPVAYVYLDPNRLRYDEPAPRELSACDGPDAPEACDQMAFNLRSETGVLLGALGTARKVELFRELTSDAWSMNLAGLATELADMIESSALEIDCSGELPLFDSEMSCADTLRRAGDLLNLAYAYRRVPIAPPFSVERLRDVRIATACDALPTAVDVEVDAVCDIDTATYRDTLAAALRTVVIAAGLEDDDLGRRVIGSGLSMRNDRALHLTTRGAPITGTLLGSFGAFLDYEFREYDYYVGVYDAVIMFADKMCGSHFTPGGHSEAFSRCFAEVAEISYRLLGVDDVPRARYVFALLARRNHGDTGELRFAYDPMPEPDRNMAIIATGLEETLATGHAAGHSAGRWVVEEEFFTTLRDEGFEPTPTADGSEPLLARIIDNPEFWSTTLVQRATNRLVYLEEQAEALFEAQEPDPDRRERASPLLMGAAAFALQSATYTYPRSTFAPSTAPPDWAWRNVIPFEVAFDFGGNDLIVAWQPTLSLDRRTNLAVRTGFGLSRGLAGSDSSKPDDSFFTLGLDWTRLAQGKMVSSWGVTPAYFHTFDRDAVEHQDTFGFDVHVGLVRNRFRVSVGARDVNDVRDTWFVLFGISDVPGAIYWLTR
jgi:hypothetical protein